MHLLIEVSQSEFLCVGCTPTNLPHLFMYFKQAIIAIIMYSSVVSIKMYTPINLPLSHLTSPKKPLFLIFHFLKFLSLVINWSWELSTLRFPKEKHTLVVYLGPRAEIVYQIHSTLRISGPKTFTSATPYVEIFRHISIKGSSGFAGRFWLVVSSDYDRCVTPTASFSPLMDMRGCRQKFFWKRPGPSPSATERSRKTYAQTRPGETVAKFSKKWLTYTCIFALGSSALKMPQCPAPGLNSRKMYRHRHVQSCPAIHRLKWHCFKARFTPIRQLNPVHRNHLVRVTPTNRP